MYCKHCGKEIDDRAVFCPNCGTETDNAKIYQQNIQPQPVANRGLVTAAKVFIIIGIVLGVCNIFSSAVDVIEELIYTAYEGQAYYLTLYIIELIVSVVWLIPNIIFGAVALNKIKACVKPSVGVSVCVLIFTNVIGGILLLCTKDKDYM